MLDIRILQLTSPDKESIAARLDRAKQLLSEQAGADLVVLPELWATGFFNFERYASDAAEWGSALTKLGATAATELNSFVHLGSIVEKDSAGQLRNSALLFNRAGQLVKRYSKVHPFGYDSGERDLVAGGSALPVTALDDARGTRVGSAICYDLRFAGLWDELRRRGAEIIVLPAAWPASRGEAREVLVRARAIEQQAFVVAATCAGAHGGVEMSGQSMIVGPDGSVIAHAEGNTEQVVRAIIDPEQAEQLRQEFPVYADRLADYRGLD